MADSVSGLNVFVRDRVCGRLGLDERRRFVFAYAPGWLREGGFPLSLSLPLRPEPYVDDEARPFFANPLAERLARGFAETEEARETVDGIVEGIRKRAGRM